jgi:hypothetical protein
MNDLPNATVYVAYDDDVAQMDDAKPVSVQFTDPTHTGDSMPVVDFMCNEDEAHDLEKQLRDVRLSRLDLVEVMTRVEDVEVGDIIGDLGFTVTKIDRLTSMFGEEKPVQLWSDSDRIWMSGNREIVVKRSTRGAMVEP